MSRFHEILEEEHRKFCESLDGQYYSSMNTETTDNDEYISIPKRFLENLKDFDYWKEWKNNS